MELRRCSMPSKLTTAQLQEIREQFPFLKEINPGIHYLDNAATSQKPRAVLDALHQSYVQKSANVHRGVYRMSEQATYDYEQVREKVKNFINARSEKEIVFTSGTTGGMNFIARSWGEQFLKEGDEILLSLTEHHSNIVPWQMVAKKVGAKINYIPLNDSYDWDLEAAKNLLNANTKVVSLGHISNVLGKINPVQELLNLAKAQGALTVIDGAQAAPHLPIDVQKLDCDFYCFSSHKMLGPTGVGVMYGKERCLNAMEPLFGGGEMISSVTIEGSTWNQIPHKFEAGTPPITQVIALGAAVDFLQGLDRVSLLNHEKELGLMALEYLKSKPQIKTFNQSEDNWTGVVTFYHQEIHPHDIAAFQDSLNVCVRAGNHCAQPLMHALNVPATIRLSPYIYNTEEDIKQFIRAMDEVEKIFAQ